MTGERSMDILNEYVVGRRVDANACASLALELRQDCDWVYSSPHRRMCVRRTHPSINYYHNRNKNSGKPKPHVSLVTVVYTNLSICFSSTSSTTLVWSELGQKFATIDDKCNCTTRSIDDELSIFLRARLP